jgi:hypothetical protein
MRILHEDINVLNTKALTLAATQPLPTPSFSEWGVGGAIALLLVREAATWFRKKEADESSLVKTLVEAQQNQIKSLTEAQQQNAAALAKLNETIRTAMAVIQRQHTETSQRQYNAAARIHERLDAIERRVVVPDDGGSTVSRSK